MSEHILVVDDEPSVLNLCRDFLEAKDFKIHTVANAFEAMDTFESGKFQLVITDINMPHMSGVELMKWIKEREPEIPVIILTGHGTYELMHEAIRSGVSDFLDKPFGLSNLERSIGKALEKRELLAERERIRVFKRLIASSERIAGEIQESSLLKYLLECLSVETGSESISVIFSGNNERETNGLRISSVEGMPKKFEPVDRQTHSPIIKSVFEGKKPIRVQDIRNDERFGNVDYDHHETYSFLCIPLVVSGNVMGVLNLAGKADGKPFSLADEEVATILANQGAIALQRTRLYSQLQGKIEEIESMFYGTIKAICNAIDAKSPWTNGHSERVMIYAEMIGRSLGLAYKEMETLRLAALLHDVGKIGTYEKVLDKPAKLTPEEYALVKLHPEKGEEILKPIKRLKHILPIIRHHHERFDGKGYPDGMKTKESPYLSRILTVADTFDSMTSKRPYRETPGREKGVEELKRCSGRQFDPEIVEAFITVLKNKEVPKNTVSTL